MRISIAVVLAVAACGPAGNRVGGGSDAPLVGQDSTTGGPDSNQNGCTGVNNCYSVYAHSDTTLYVVDLMAKTLTRLGPFNAPGSDVITDLAVAPDNTIYVISETALYTASATDGHVTMVGSLATCGQKAVALTTTPDGKMWAGDFKGAICNIDTTASPPTVTQTATMSNGMALSGDFVAVADGTVFGTAYMLADPANMASQINNLLVTIDLTTGSVVEKGASGFPKLFGASFALGKVFGFTHDTTGHVVEIDPATGVGTLYATFTDPMTQTGISFAGAGVNSLVPIIE